MRPGTLVELARRNGAYLTATDPTELYRYDSLNGLLRVFWLVQSTLTGGEDWPRLAYESVIDGAVRGLVHREAFFTQPATWREVRASWPWSPGWARASPRPKRRPASRAC